MDPHLLKTALPFVVIVVVLGLRLRSMSKAQPLKSQRLWITPAILVVLGLLSLVANPPPPAGLAICGATFILGFGLGWQRGKLIRIWRDETGNLMQQASPAAMFLLLGIIAARYLLRTYFGGPGSTGDHMDARTLLITDALLTFAIGLIAATRIELALRAKRLLEG